MLYSSDSSTVFGTLEKCPSTPLQAWAQQAQDHFGSVTGWTHVTFAEVGILIGEKKYMFSARWYFSENSGLWTPLYN